MEKKLIYKDTEYHTYSCTGKKNEIKRLEYKENYNLEERFKIQDCIVTGKQIGRAHV